MSDEGSDRVGALRELGERIAGTSHDDLSAGTIDRVQGFVKEVQDHVDREEISTAARQLLAFWESYIRTELEAALDDASALSESAIDQFERAFDEEMIGVDLYEALETLAIVEDMPDGETDEDRLALWTRRVKSLTEDFAAHLERHRD